MHKEYDRQRAMRGAAVAHEAARLEYRSGQLAASEAMKEVAVEARDLLF